MKKTKQNSEHYKWGDNCDGWHLVKSENLSVIEELMPPNTQEQRHYHVKSEQFFRVLKGIASFEIEDNVIELRVGEGMHVLPKQKHSIKNEGSENLEFLVISQPPSHGDRFKAEE